MNRIRILLVENTPSMAAAFRRKLERDKRFSLEERGDAEAAIRAVQKEDFDVVFIDLHLAEKDSGEPIFDGIGVGEEVRKGRNSNAAVVMYSQQIRYKEEKEFKMFEQCQHAGADEIMARAFLFSSTQEDLSALIDKLMERRREIERTAIQIKFADDLRTQAALDAFDSTQIQRIIAKCVPDHPHLEVNALRSGFSGATVFRVIAASDKQFTNPLRLIVKISRSRFALEDELRRWPQVGSRYPGSSPPPHTHAVVSVNDFLHAVAIEEVRNKTLLFDYLVQGKLTRPVEKVLARVVKELLVQPARQSLPAEDFHLEENTYRLRPFGASLIDDFLSESMTWLTVLKERDIKAVQAARRLVAKALDGHWQWMADGRHAALLHGDFHSHNVFVSADDAPALIDFGRTDVYPRLFDFAALDADLIMSVLDYDLGKGQDFSRIQRWFGYLMKSYPFATGPSESSSPQRFDFLRNTLLKEVQKLAHVSRSEYAEALMFHYLRYIRFPTVPVPKRILAARAIENLCDLLQIN